MKDKRFLIAAVVLVVIAIVLVVLLRADKPGYSGGNEQYVDTTPISKVNLEEVFKELEKIEGIGDGEMPAEENDLSGEAMDNEESNIENPDDEQEEIIPEEEIDFGRFEGLEKKAIVKTTDDQVNEIWMIKLGNIKQQEDVCRILGNRIQKLKNAFEDDAVQTNILKRAVIKQEDGVIIMIASPQDDEVEKTIAKVMKQ